MTNKPPPSSQSDAHKTRDRATRFRVSDFLRKDGVDIASPDDGLSMDDTLLHGNFLHAELRPGLFLHLSDVTEERPFTATSILPGGLSCIFFLDGMVDLTIGDRGFHFAGPQTRAVIGTTIMSTRSERFQRSSRRRQHLSHLVVSASPEWLDLDGLTNFQDTSHGTRLLNNHLGEHQWVLTPRALEVVRQILQPSPFVPQLHNLFLEGRAVEIVAESLAASMRTEPEIDQSTILTRQDRIKLQRAVDLISENMDASLSVDRIAREAGVSASGLQRLFRLSAGQSVFDYVRGQRLERAHTLLKANEVTIPQASTIAGYSNPANFATAFRKRFGITPREVAARRAISQFDA